MSSVREKGERIRRFIIDNVEAHPGDIARATAEKFGISRQATNTHLARLTREKILKSEGETRNRKYTLCPLTQWRHAYPLAGSIEEDIVWSKDISTCLGSLPDNATRIWHHGFTEMLNNAIDHSGGSKATVQITKTAAAAEMWIIDDGVGIFKKIKNELDLVDERHAILELAKGKLTTDPDRHSGEGIFFTSRMFDDFAILSGGIVFSHEYGVPEDWIHDGFRDAEGTAVFMKLNNHTSRTVKKVFDRFTSDDDFAFSRTVVPVRMASLGEDQLVSRSQAKRMLARIEKFTVAIFDFQGVREIGQAFADEVFRVFARQHPQITLDFANANSAIKRMIYRAKEARDDIEGQNTLF